MSKLCLALNMLLVIYFKRDTLPIFDQAPIWFARTVSRLGQKPNQCNAIMLISTDITQKKTS